MRLRRRTEPALEVDEDFAASIALLWTTFEGNLARCRRLTEAHAAGSRTDEDRREARRGAGEIAAAERTVTEWLTVPGQADALPAGLLPPEVHGAAARLAYALVGLAEEEPEPEELLTIEEIDGLPAQYVIEPWRTMFQAQLDDRVSP